MRKITFIIDDIAYLKELYKEELTEEQATDIFSDLKPFKARFTVIGERYADRYELNTIDGEKLDLNSLNGYQKGCIITDCYTYFEGKEKFAFDGVNPHGVVEIIEEQIEG